MVSSARVFSAQTHSWNHGTGRLACGEIRMAHGCGGSYRMERIHWPVLRSWRRLAKPHGPFLGNETIGEQKGAELGEHTTRDVSQLFQME